MMTPSRREVLKYVAAGAVPKTIDKLTAMPTENTPATDAHVHIWTDDVNRYPLASGFSKAMFACERFGPADILTQAKENGVSRVVLVQMSYYGFDNSFMLDAITHWPAQFRGIAIVDGRDPHVEQTMKRLKSLGVRGFRVVFGGPEDNRPPEPDLRRMFACCAKENLAICALINPGELPDLGRLCADFSETPVVIDHMARIGMAGPVRQADIDALCALSRYPRVMIKISAFYALGAKRPPYLDLEPLIRDIYRSFGAARLMWGSDAPFQVLSGTYHDSIALVRDHLSFLSQSDRRKILHQTADDFFFGEKLHDVHPQRQRS